MTTIQSSRTRTSFALPLLSSLGETSIRLTRFVSRAARAYSERVNLMQIESLPDDLRKDIGWPGGPAGR